MTEAAEGTLLWEPSEEFKENANITRYMRWLKEEKNLFFGDYGELWEWSVTDLEDFWVSIWEYFKVKASKPYERVLAEREISVWTRARRTMPSVPLWPPGSPRPPKTPGSSANRFKGRAAT
jgi:hypothetical protein